MTTTTKMSYISINPAENGWVLSVTYVTEIEQGEQEIRPCTQKTWVYSNYHDMIAFLAQEFDQQ